MAPALAGPALTPLLPNLTEIYLAELAGDVADSKEVDAVKAKVKEARGRRAPAIFEIIGSKVLPEVLVSDVLPPLTAALRGVATLKLRRRYEEVLNSLCAGLLANDVVDPPRWVTVAARLFDAHLPSDVLREFGASKAAKLRPLHDPTARAAPKGGGAVLSREGPCGVNDHVIAEFGFAVLHGLLKRDRVGGAARVGLSLEEWGGVILHTTRSVRSSHDSTAVLALKCYSLFVKGPLAELLGDVSAVVMDVFEILQRGGAVNAPLPQACFKVPPPFFFSNLKKLCTSIIRHNKYEMTSGQIKVRIC
jgi:hypothetical protein